VTLEDAETQTSFGALCPLLSDVKNTSRRAAPTCFQASSTHLSLIAMQPVKPGEELFQKMAEGESGAQLLASLGIVPGAEQLGVPGDKELLEMNMSATTMLQIPPIVISDFPPSTYVGLKLQLLADYAGLELAAPRLSTASVKKTSFKLPDEAIGTGRLLPTARFLNAEIQALPGSSTEWMNRFFVRFFKHCNLEGGYPSLDNAQQIDPKSDGTQRMMYTAELEVQARNLVAQWCREAIIDYAAVVDEISRATGLPVGSGEGVIVVTPGQVVLSYFKSRRKDGSTGKSRKPREARVISVGDSTLRVEFLANGRRHEVPSGWVVGAQPVPTAGLLAAGCTPDGLKRGKLAITLLRTEKAILGMYLRALTQSAEVLQGLLSQAKNCNDLGDIAGLEKCSAAIRDFLSREMLELDEETQSLQPQTLDQLPQLGEDGQPLPPTDPNRPLWNLPPVSEMPESAFVPDVVMVMEGLPADASGRPTDAPSGAKPQESPDAEQG